MNNINQVKVLLRLVNLQLEVIFQLQQMEAAIAQLPEQDQQLLRLHYYEQRHTADIARQTGLSQSNVLVRLHRIRERLKKAMTYERND